MGEVIILPVVTRLDIPVDRIVNDKVATELASAVVVGYDQDGNFYFASSIASGPEVVWRRRRQADVSELRARRRARPRDPARRHRVSERAVAGPGLHVSRQREAGRLGPT